MAGAGGRGRADGPNHSRPPRVHGPLLTRAHRHEHTHAGGGGTRAPNQDEGCADTGRVSAHQEEKRRSALAAEVRRSGSSHGAGLGQWVRGRVEGAGWRVGRAGLLSSPRGRASHWEAPMAGRSAHPHQAGVPGPLLSVLERLPVTSTVSPARAFRPELYPTDGSRREL